MALVSPSQLLGKTIYLKSPSRFYRAADIVSQGDKAKPVSNSLKAGYFFVFDSFMAPTEANNKFGFQTAKRSDYYFTWYGADGRYYAIKYQPNLFDMSKLKEQGLETVQEQLEKEKNANKPWYETIFQGLGKNVKTVLFIGLAVWSVGYLMEKNKN